MNRDFIFVRDYVIDCHIGVYAEEHGTTQKVSLTVDAHLSQGIRATRDVMEEVPSYTDIIDAIDEISGAGHIELVETFAERICERLLKDKRFSSVRVRIEKLERGPIRGVEITRARAGV
jgi:dihydroneopterin aldolase